MLKINKRDKIGDWGIRRFDDWVTGELGDWLLNKPVTRLPKKMEVRFYMILKAEELLAGGALTHEVEIPEDLLSPDGASHQKDKKEKSTVVLRPLTVKDIQLIVKAAKDNNVLASSLILQQALVEPNLKIEQINLMSAGLVKFLVEKVNQISGLLVSEDGLSKLVQAPLAKACFIMAKEFGWTPQQVSEMTIGQILLYLEMINESNK